MQAGAILGMQQINLVTFLPTILHFIISYTFDKAQLLVLLKSNTVEVDRDNNNHSLPLFPCPLRMLGEYNELPAAVANTNSLSFVVCSCSRGCARHCSAEDGRTVDVQWSESTKNTARLDHADHDRSQSPSKVVFPVPGHPTNAGT